MGFSTLVKAVFGVSVMMFVKMKSWKVCQVHKELYGPCSLHQPLGVGREAGRSEFVERGRGVLKTWGGFYSFENKYKLSSDLKKILACFISRIYYYW